MAKLWAQITGALPDDDTGSTDAGLDDAGGLDLGLDLADDADETAAVTAKIAAARELAAQDVDVPDVDPEMWQRVVAERRRQFDATYTDVNLPEADQAAILAMLAAPGGVVDPRRGRRAALVTHDSASAAAAVAARRCRRDAGHRLGAALAPHRTGSGRPAPRRVPPFTPSRTHPPDRQAVTHRDRRLVNQRLVNRPGLRAL